MELIRPVKEIPVGYQFQKKVLDEMIQQDRQDEKDELIKEGNEVRQVSVDLMDLKFGKEVAYERAPIGMSSLEEGRLTSRMYFEGYETRTPLESGSYPGYHERRRSNRISRNETESQDCTQEKSEIIRSYPLTETTYS